MKISKLFTISIWFLTILMLITSLLFSITFLGCGGGSGGGGGDSESPSPKRSINVLPSSYDFGTVTPGNTPAPLRVEIKNEGTTSLNVSDISLQDTTNFTLNLNGGLNPCSSATPLLPAGDGCTIEVRFQPQSSALFRTKLTISSNDPAIAKLNLPLSGSQADISTLNVRINQVEIACPSGIVSAYVSVTDQGGYPVLALTEGDFSVTETTGYAGPPASSPYVENNATIATALVMDYSSSITSHPDRVSDMEEGAVSFINQLAAGDETEIIKFGPIIEVVQSFTSDNNLLISAIITPWNKGSGTALYDAGKKAVDDIVLRSKDRKAVILITDGFDNDSIFGVDDLIDYAFSQNVPFFTVGLGSDANVMELTKLADYTGGKYYSAANSDNLHTIYQQLADVLFSFQYILTYSSGLADGTTADLTVGATLPSTTIVGSNTKSITKCP